MVVEEAVQGVASLATNSDQAGLAKQAELVRRCTGRETGSASEVIDGAFFFEQRPEKLQSAGGREQPHRLRQRCRFGLAKRAGDRVVFVRIGHLPRVTEKHAASMSYTRAFKPRRPPAGVPSTRVPT